MKPLLVALAVLLLLSSGCTGTPPAAWVRPDDKSLAPASDTSQCRVESRRLSLERYPDQIQTSNGVEHRVSNPDRFSAELTLFDQCMRRLGYRRSDELQTRT